MTAAGAAAGAATADGSSGFELAEECNSWCAAASAAACCGIGKLMLWRGVDATDAGSDGGMDGASDGATDGSFDEATGSDGGI